MHVQCTGSHTIWSNVYFWSFFLFDNMIVWVYADITVYMTYVSYRFNMLDTHDQPSDHVN